MREETREEAEALLAELAGVVEPLLGQKPALHIREGRIGEEILAHIDESGSVDLLVVGAAPPDDGHGSLISWLAGQLAGRLNIPLVVVPGNLSDKQLRDLT
jgi:nucleotide-binding universal stress UspA family protein